MTSNMLIPSFFRRIAKQLYIVVALITIVFVIGMVAFRLAVTQLQSYRGEIQTWAQDALGLTIDFNRVDARWALSGPELTLYDVEVSIPGTGDGSIFSAAQTSIGLSAITFVKKRRLAISRLIVADTRLIIERLENGSVRLRGAPEQQNANTGFRIEDLPAVEVIVRNSTVVFEDALRDVSWEFPNAGLRFAREGNQLQIEARAEAPAALASRIDISAEGGVSASEDNSENWRIVAELRDLDLSALPEFFPDSEGIPRAGVGDVSVWFDLIRGKLEQATVQLALENLHLGDNPELSVAEPNYETLVGTIEWSRQVDGWQVAFSNVNLRRQSRSWPGGVSVSLQITESADALNGFRLSSSFLRLEDITPLILALPENFFTESWLAFAPRGDLLEFAFDWNGGADTFTYSAEADFRDIGISENGQWPGVTGLSGEVRADSRSGRIALSSRNSQFDWQAIFRQPLSVDEMIGALVWRQGQDGTRIVSDNLTLKNADLTTRSNFELTIPPDGSSPLLELETTIGRLDTAIISHYLPTGALPTPVVSWLDRSIVSGYIPRAALTFVGPIIDFPFYDGKGRFSATVDIEDGVLDFVEDWPDARDISGTVEFLNEGFTARGTGNVIGENPVTISGGIPDMRNAVVLVDGQTTASMSDVLGYLKEAPFFAQQLGSDLRRLESNLGTTDVDFFLHLPLKDLTSYELDVQLDMHGGELSVEGIGLAATEINGQLNINQDGVTGEGIEATLLDGPVTASVSSSDEEGYRAELDFEGEVLAESVGVAFNLPISAYLKGKTLWKGKLMLPSNTRGETTQFRAPLRLMVESNLSGVALQFPSPLAKLSSESWNFLLDFAFVQSEHIDIEGNFGDENRFSLNFWNRDDGLLLRRGSIRFGGSSPLLIPQDGLDIRGSLGQLNMDEWAEVFGEFSPKENWNTSLSVADFEVADFSIFDQRLGQTTLNIETEVREWLIDIQSTPVAGQIVVPLDLSNRPQILADMRQLHLTSGEFDQSTEIDPRNIPGLLITASDFVFGARHYGELRADIRAEPLGLRFESIQTVNEGFTLEGSGNWFARADGFMTRVGFTARSENVGSALDELGLDPVLEGESAKVTANVSWFGNLSADWRKTISGDVVLEMDQGSVLDLEPGAGRMMGLMSFTELPRRLALDFRDVFNRGLVFDAVTGAFVLIDGSAYTDNLLLTGPVADIGVVGRTGLKDQTYQQQAIVTVEPGKILPAMGFLAGTGVGAALLLFTEIFKEPLKGIGRASYCMSGTWDDPLIERLSPENLVAGELCADLPSGGLNLSD